MRSAISIRVLVVACLLVAAVSTQIWCQTTTGRILGEVHDQSGASVSGATVTVADVQRGTSRTVTTDTTGNYIVPALPPGTYVIRVEAKGFKKVERPNVVLEVAKDADIDFSLQPGNVSETITVTEEVPLVDTTSATLGGTLSNNEINDLPLNGRNYENLLQLRPGVERYPGGGFSTTSTDGLRAEDNAYLIEGLFNSEPYSGQGIINGAGIAGDSATILPIDSIQEFNLEENPPAEFGWKPGAIVNVGLKSGTNQLHGTAFAFGRDGATDARNFFNTVPSPKTDRTLEQFGGSFGGPIVKNKVFFFGAYEGQIYDVGNTFSVTTPSMKQIFLPGAPGTNSNCLSASLIAVNGDCLNSIPLAIQDLTLSGVPISAASQKVSGCNASGVCDGTGFPMNNTTGNSITQGFPNDVTVHNGLGKIDVNLTQKNHLSGMYFFGNNSGTVEDFPELQTQWRSKIHTRAQVAGGSWAWTPSPRWVNEARIGYNRLYQPTLPGDLNTPASAYGLDTGVSGPFTGGLPRIGFAGAFVPGLGGFKWPKFQGPDSITQFSDHVSYSAGAHAIKFGGELHYNRVNNGAFANARGSITFTGGNTPDPANPANVLNTTNLEDFFSGAPLKVSVLTGDPRVKLSNWAYSLFAQDTWRASRNFTLNFGLRYEYSTPVKEANDHLGNFDPNLGLVQVGKQISSPYNGDHSNFAPRLGFAWDLYGQGKTVLRGGAGLTYEAVNWQSFIAFNNSFGLGNVPTGAIIDGKPGPGNITTGNLTIFPSYPWDNGNIYDLGSNPLSCSAGAPCAIMSVAHNLKTPYVWNWTVSLQHAITPNLSLDLAYVGNHGSKLTGIRDINQPPMGAGFSPLCSTDPNCEQDLRPFVTKFDYLSNIFQMGNVYRSNYNGLQATLNSRNFHGLNMVIGYTYSHALDDVGANWDFGYGYGLPQNSYNLNAEYANSDFDVRHRFTASLTYAIPGKKGYGQAFEGWEVNSIMNFQSSQFWGPMDLGTDVAGTGPLPFSPPATSLDRWDFYGNPNDFKSGPNGIPYFAPGDPNMPASCASHAAALGPNGTASLNSFGCYAAGNSVMIPPALGTFGTMRRNIFPDSGFKNVDFSVAKNFHFGERMRAQFRAEFFNILNHPNFANPYGGQNGFGFNDPSVFGNSFGCGCATPDVAAANPVIGSGGPRAMQFGLKFIF